MECFAQSSKKVMENFDTQDSGLSNDEAKKRLEKYGENKLKKEKRSSILKILLEQLKDPFLILLSIAAILSFVTSAMEHGFVFESYLESLAIIVIILFSIILGFIQEYRAEKALEALEHMSAPHAKVIRNNEEKDIPAAELVPGDIILLEEGTVVPADCRIIEEHSLQIDEASLTGESVPSKKITNKLNSGLNTADQTNMAFMNTIVTYGKGKAIVATTGMNTEIGKIAESLSDTKEVSTPLQKKLTKLAKSISMIIMVLIFIVFLAGIIKGKADIQNMLIFAISLAVAAVPNSLPVIVTVGLSLGAKRLAQKNMLIKKLSAAESLGSVTVICSDKTGTLTRNEMTITRVFTNDSTIEVTGSGYSPTGEFLKENKKTDPKNIELLMRIGLLCNNSELEKEGKKYKILGDPTEGSLKVLSKKGNLDEKKIKSEYKFIEELPFDSDRKMMSVIYEDNKNKKYAYIKGAPDLLLRKCTKILENGKIRKITEKDRKKISETNHSFAKDALRVLGLSFREVKDNEKKDIKTIEKDLVFVGLVGMMDPPREEVKKSIKQCNDAGIKVMMITGDHAITAQAIGKKIGLHKKGNLVLTGEDLDNLDDQQLEAKIDDISIIARALPIQKSRVVDALKKKGHIVSMTGDGVNDAPALKKADIGIAMGITGTDVSKEVAKGTLIDDNFATIVNAIEEGRNIYAKMIKSVRYLLSCNAGEIVSVFIAIMLNFPLPMIPLQILLMNLLTDNFPALGLGFEPSDKNIMKESPRDPKEKPIPMNMAILIVMFGLLMGIMTVIMFNIYLPESLEKARTVAFTTLVMFEMFAVISSRSMKPSIEKLNPLTNMWLTGGIILSLILQMIVIYWTPMQNVFETVSLSGHEWIWIILVSFMGFIMMELGKMIIYSKKHILGGKSH